MAMTKTAPLSKEKALNVVYDFFNHFQTWISSGKAPSGADLEKHLSPHFKFTSNGHILCRSSADYLARVKKFQERYSRFEISKPLEEPLSNDNEIALYYRIDLTQKKGGANQQVYILAIGTIEDNHIARWTQVTHQQGTSDWDK